MRYLEVTISTWALQAKHGKSSGRALPSSPYLFLQLILVLSGAAFQKPVFFLEGPSQWTFPRPLGRTGVVSPPYAHAETSSQGSFIP